MLSDKIYSKLNSSLKNIKNDNDLAYYELQTCHGWFQIIFKI